MTGLIYQIYWFGNINAKKRVEHLEEATNPLWSETQVNSNTTLNSQFFLANLDAIVRIERNNSLIVTGNGEWICDNMTEGYHISLEANVATSYMELYYHWSGNQVNEIDQDVI